MLSKSVMEQIEQLHITGIKINYLFVCERKLWFFDRGITMERHSDQVLLGRLLEETSYPREKKKRITIDDLIAIDILQGNAVDEVKSSRKMHQASVMQLCYYLYYLKQLGIEKKGILRYPRLRKKEEIVLTPERIREVERAVAKVSAVLRLATPPPAVRKSYCPRCAYFEFCFG